VRYIVLLFSIIAIQTQAKIWRVGAAKTYTKPSQVANLVADNDTVFIDAGIYDSDVCGWTKNNLFIKAVGGFSHLRANGNTYGGKAIWVISGKNAKIDSIEFSLASCVDKNGAGIRLEGTDLTVSHCYFHDNEDGILAGADTNSTISIENSEFYNNGAGDGFSHNLYIGHIKKLFFRYNYSHHAKVGHELKSRANENFILYNRFDEEADGTASRSIDLPNGGFAIVLGNEIIKGAASQNSNFVEFGVEGLTNTGPHKIYMVHNTFVNNRSGSAIFLTLQSGVTLCKLYNNIFAGTGNFTFAAPAQLDTASNIYGNIASQKFKGTTGNEFALTANSPAVNKSTNAGNAGVYALQAIREYVHPSLGTARNNTGAADAGAHEYANPANVRDVSVQAIYCYPNPALNKINILVQYPGILRVYDVNHKLIIEKEFQMANEYCIINSDNFNPGAYFATLHYHMGGELKISTIKFMRN
jgi:hypothetical protein